MIKRSEQTLELDELEEKLSKELDDFDDKLQKVSDEITTLTTAYENSWTTIA